MSELGDCQFCGHALYVNEMRWEGKTKHLIQCKGNSYHEAEDWYDTKQEAIDAWMSREPVKTMEDELAIGEKAIADLIDHMSRMGVSSVEDGNFRAVLTPEEMEKS